MSQKQTPPKENELLITIRIEAGSPQLQERVAAAIAAQLRTTAATLDRLARKRKRKPAAAAEACPSCGLPLAQFAGPAKGERGTICQTPGCDMQDLGMEEAKQ
jgi:hypothetical protein